MTYLVLLFQLWPFDINTTLIMLFGVYQMASLLVTGQWEQLKLYAVNECLVYFSSALKDNDKFDKIFESVRKKLPFWMRPFVTQEKLEQMIQDVYTLRAKPQAKKKRIPRGVVPLAPDNEATKEALLNEIKRLQEKMNRETIEIAEPQDAPEKTNENPLAHYFPIK